MKAHSIEFRQKIINVYESEPISQRQLAKRFCVAKSFVEKLLKQRRETGSIAPKVRTQQTPTKLNSEQLSTLARLVEEHNDATLDELRQLLAEETGVSIGRSTLDRMLKKLKITRKKTLHADEKESEAVQVKRVQFWNLVQGILAKNLIFIDESGINLALTRSHARSPQGKRAHGKRPQKRGKNVSVIGAIGLEGIIAHVAVMGSVDKLTFEAFIACKLVPRLWAGACVMMDNCSIHLNEEVEKLITAAGAQLFYLPPYSPDFSPIENFWSKVKAILRAIQARLYPELAAALETAFGQVSQEDIEHWYTHCCYCTSLD